MRTILFLNNWGGWQLAQWLRARQDDLVGLVVHPDSNQRFATEIVDAARVRARRIWTALDLQLPQTLDAIRRLQPHIGVAGWFGYVLKPQVIDLFCNGCINVQTAYLPWNRGCHAHMWPILDGSPAGVTMHYIDGGIGTGDLIAQRRLPVTRIETGGSLHRTLTLDAIALFKETWPHVVAGTNRRIPQDHSRATWHGKADLTALDEIDRGHPYVARELLNLLRARTCPPYPSAYYVDRRTGARRHVRVELAKATPYSSPEGIRIDIDGRYEAGALIDGLRGSRARSGWPAYYMDGGCAVQVRATVVDPITVDPEGYPEWLNTAYADSSADTSAPA